MLVASGSATHEYAGFYMAYPNTAPIIVQPGQSYSIVMTQQLLDNGAPTGQYAINMPSGLGKDSAYIDLFHMLQYQMCVVNEGESFLYMNDAWDDWSHEDVRNRFIPDSSEDPVAAMYGITNENADYQVDNFPIKGYAFDLAEDPWYAYVRIANGANVTVCKGGTTTVAYELYGPDAEEAAMADFIVTWGLADGGEVFVDLVPNDDGTAQLVWKKPAKATYSCTEGDGSTWTKGSSQTLNFTFKRSVEDNLAFGLFAGIKVDGADVVASNYTAEEGSVVMKLSASYLSPLSVGSHAITATFEDGAATAAFTVKAAEGSGDSDGDTPGADPSDGDTPSTDPSDGGTPGTGPSDGDTPDAGPSDAGTASADPSGAGTPSTGPSDASTPNTGDSPGNAAIVAAVLAAVSCADLVFARRRMRI